ncbi:unnamed protein product [Sphagnum jensenii]|uniref:Uncharacterized protein n=1 Tax=Sphagnum jensenii TaxID=128206 RepID=A0ABP0W0R7_9BRYO
MTPSSRFSSSQSSYSSSSSWMTNSMLLAPSCPRAAVACAQFAGTLRILTFIHKHRHIVMMNTNDDNNYRVHVNSRPAALLTRFDGVTVAGVPW